MNCNLRNDEEFIASNLGAKKINGEWRPAGGNEKGCELRELAKSNFCILIDNLPFYPEDNLRVLTLNGSNWQGIGILVDDAAGNKKTRQRHFRYCLYHDDVALCGQVAVRNLMKPYNDVLPTVLAVLNSIEFVDVSAQPDLLTPVQK